MGSPRSFRPQLAEALEDRVVLSRLSVRPAAVVAPKTPPVIARINAAFDSFTQDYTQTRAAYLAGLVTITGTDKTATDSLAALKTSFTNYTVNRVNLLGQQLNKSLFHVSINSSKTNSHTSANLRFTSLVSRTVSGLQLKPNTTPPELDGGAPFRVGTMGASLVSAIPSAPGGGDQAKAQNGLNSLAQDQAIQAARAAVINGFIFVKATSFTGKKS
jgi:hypothetical protein